MRAILRVLCVLALVGTATAAFSQQYYGNGGVRRVIKYRILPGKTGEFYKWLSSFPKVMEAEKQAGVIEGYSVMHSTEFVGPDKYDIVLVISYKDMAAMDTAPEKSGPISEKIFGGAEARTAYFNQGAQYYEVVSSELVREIHLK
ncbi:MAG TPA: hypothetical protein VN734_05805 [Acidobacteriaceae bacterium]|nr:hypothetical protein [Acidobacteriaceae bacterium]